MLATLIGVTLLLCHFSTMIVAFWRLVIDWLYTKFFKKSYFLNVVNLRIWLSVLQRIISPLFKQESLAILVVFLVLLHNVTPMAQKIQDPTKGGGQNKDSKKPETVTVPFVMPTAPFHYFVEIISQYPRPAPPSLKVYYQMNIPLPAPGPIGHPLIQGVPWPAPGPVAMPVAAPVPMPGPGVIPVPNPVHIMLPYPGQGQISPPIRLPLGRDISSGFLTMTVITIFSGLFFVAFCGGLIAAFGVYSVEKKIKIEREIESRIRHKTPKTKIMVPMPFRTAAGGEQGSIEAGNELPTTSKEQQELDVQVSDETTDLKLPSPRPYVPPGPWKIEQQSKGDYVKYVPMSSETITQINNQNTT